MKNNLVMKLTNRPISDELQDIIDRLSEGKFVSVDELNNTNEIKLARSIISHDRETIELIGRESLRAKIIDELAKKGSVTIDENGKVEYNGIVNNNSRLDIVIGLPSSGKSSALVDVLSADYHSKVIDCDEAKTMLPEYNNGWGSSVVHHESQEIERTVFTISLKRKENIVLPKVGGNYDKLLKDYILPAKEKGYSIYVHYIEVDRNKALGRMVQRFVTDGRFLEPEVMDKYAPMINNQIDNKIEKTYCLLKEGGMLDGYSKRNNDVGYGEQPIIIEEYEKETGRGTDQVGQTFIQGNGRGGRGGQQIRGVDEESGERGTILFPFDYRSSKVNGQHNVSEYGEDRSGRGVEEKAAQNMVYIKLHKTYCKQIPDKIHEGKTFNMIYMPKGTILNGQDVSGYVINPKLMYENPYNPNEMVAQYDLNHMNDSSILLKNLNEATSEKVNIFELKAAIEIQKENYKKMPQNEKGSQIAKSKDKDKDKGEEL